MKRARIRRWRVRRAVDPLTVAHDGRIAERQATACSRIFSVVDALNCAVEMQQASRAMNDPMPRAPSRLRIGVNLGDVIVDGEHLWRWRQHRRRLEGRATRDNLHFAHGLRPGQKQARFRLPSARQPSR
jgi:hypothetical protein